MEKQKLTEGKDLIKYFCTPCSPTKSNGGRVRNQPEHDVDILPSGRRLAYVKPRMGQNVFGGESVTYEGVGVTKKFEKIEIYGPKFVENIVQAFSRDI